MEQYAVDWTEWAVHHILFWESDDKKKGRIVRALHHFGTYALVTLVIISHTIYPTFWFQTCVVFFYGIIWIHHVLTNGCVVSKVEQRLIGDNNSFVDPYLELFNIEADEKSKQGILILGSTLCISLLSLEWVSRLFHKIIVLLKSQSLIGSSIPNTLQQLSSLSG